MILTVQSRFTNIRAWSSNHGRDCIISGLLINVSFRIFKDVESSVQLNASIRTVIMISFGITWLSRDRLLSFDSKILKATLSTLMSSPTSNDVQLCLSMGDLTDVTTMFVFGQIANCDWGQSSLERDRRTLSLSCSVFWRMKENSCTDLDRNYLRAEGRTSWRISLVSSLRTYILEWIRNSCWSSLMMMYISSWTVLTWRNDLGLSAELSVTQREEEKYESISLLSSPVSWMNFVRSVPRPLAAMWNVWPYDTYKNTASRCLQLQVAPSTRHEESLIPPAERMMTWYFDYLNGVPKAWNIFLFSIVQFHSKSSSWIEKSVWIHFLRVKWIVFVLYIPLPATLHIPDVKKRNTSSRLKSISQ